MEYKNNGYTSAFQNYGKSQSIELKPFYNSDLKESLEKTVIEEKPQKEEGLVGKIFSDKGKNLMATVKALLKEIELRENLNSSLLNNIDNKICRQHTYMGQIEYMKGGYSMEQEREKVKLKTKLEDGVLELEKEKRKEYLECWRDLMFMNKYLFSALKDYWELSRKRDVLSYDLNTYGQNENIK